MDGGASAEFGGESAVWVRGIEEGACCDSEYWDEWDSDVVEDDRRHGQWNQKAGAEMGVNAAAAAFALSTGVSVE